MKKSRLLSAIEEPLSLFDYIMFAVIAIICFLSFQQGDIMHTAGSSYGFLQGHILDYYDWVAYEYDIWDSYMPSTYILYAIWNIPMMLFGIVTKPEEFAAFWVIMWYKILPTMFYIGSAVLVYKIASQIGMGSKKSKLCAYAFLTAPIGFFSQFMFGQYDSFTVFFLLLGILYYFRKNDKLFILFFGLAIPFKLWPLLFFIPLLLLREKNIWKIIRNIIFVAVPYGIEFVLYYSNDVFRQYVLGFSATGYVSATGLVVGDVTISYVILLWGFICAYAYFKKIEDDTEEAKWSLFLCCMVIVALFGLSQWHPQWLLLAMPFFVLTAFINKNVKLFLFTDIIMMLFFSMFVVNTWTHHVDQELFSWGIFGDYIYKYIGTKLMMRDIYLIKDTKFLYTIFTALLVVSALFKHPRFCDTDFKTEISNSMKWIRARFLIGVGIFVIPAVICFVVAMQPPYAVYKVSDANILTNPLVDCEMSQVFESPAEELTGVGFKVATYARENDINIDVSIIKHDTGEVVGTRTVNAKNFKDNQYVSVDFSGVKIEPGEMYRLTLACDDATYEECITLYRTEGLSRKIAGGAMIGEEEQEYHLAVIIYATEKSSK